MSTKDSETADNPQRLSAAHWRPFADLGGVSGGISTLGDGAMSWHGQNPADVAVNREKFFRSIGLEPNLAVSGDQVHGSEIHRVRRIDAGRGIRSPEDRIPATDALATEEPGIILTTLHADCAPIFVCDIRRPAIALVHAGWRGCLAGLAGAVVRRLQNEFSSSPADLRVAIGPLISPAAYAVSPELADRFADQFGADVIMRQGPAVHLDLYRVICIDLQRAGLTGQQLPQRPPCTFHDGRYASFRRMGHPVPSMLAYLVLAEGSGIAN